MLRRSPRAFGAALFLLVPALGAGQAPQDRFVEQIEVRVVDLDVVVTDRQGNPLTDLRREDFELLEDGKPVEIKYFSRIVEGRLESEEAAAEPSGDPAAPAVRAPLTWAIFVDQTNMRPSRRNEALRRLRPFFEGAMTEGDRAIVATFDGLAFRIRGSFIEDRNALLAVLTSLEKERFAAGPAYTQEIVLRAEVQRSIDPLEDGQDLADQIDKLISQEAARQSNAIAAVRALIDVMAGVEGRQAIVYVGTGFNTLPALGVTEAWRNRFPGLVSWIGAPKPEDQQFRLENEITELYERLSASRATFYSVFAGDAGSGVMSAEEALSIEMEEAPTLGERAALGTTAATRELADRTGGVAFKVNANLDRQMRAVTRDLTHYYSLGYAPKGPSGKPRKLSVRVTVDGARVRHREGVRERTPDERAADSVVAALFNPGDANPMDISVDLEPSRRAGRGRGRLIPVRVRVPISSLAFLRRGDTHQGGLAFHVALAAPDGTVWRLESKELPIEIPHAELASALGKDISYGFEIPLQAEGMRIAVSVQDRLAPQIRSIVTIPLESRRR